MHSAPVPDIGTLYRTLHIHLHITTRAPLTTAKVSEFFPTNSSCQRNRGLNITSAGKDNGVSTETEAGLKTFIEGTIPKSGRKVKPPLQTG